MTGQFILELKKQPKWLYGLWFAALLAVLGMGLIGRELRTHNIGLFVQDRYGNEQTVWDGGTTKSEYRYVLFGLKQQLAYDQKYASEAGETASQEQVESDKKLLCALEDHNYLKFNHICLEMVDTPHATIPGATDFSTSLSGRVAETRARLQYLVAGELALTFRQIHDNFVINLHRSLILFGSNRNWST